jgi:hypothetical protein
VGAAKAGSMFAKYQLTLAVMCPVDDVEVVDTGRAQLTDATRS